MKCIKCNNQVFEGSLRQQEIINKIYEYNKENADWENYSNYLKSLCLECLKKELNKNISLYKQKCYEEFLNEHPTFKKEMEKQTKALNMLKGIIGPGYYDI